MSYCSHNSYSHKGGEYYCDSCGEKLRLTRDSSGNVIAKAIGRYAVMHAVIQALSIIFGG